MSSPIIKFKIAPDGESMSTIYSDALVGLYQEAGQFSVSRASHVEPNAQGEWVADMSPVHGPTLPAKKLRQEALDAEVEWINNNIF